MVNSRCTEDLPDINRDYMMPFVANAVLTGISSYTEVFDQFITRCFMGKTWMRVIALCEIIGGIVGIPFVIWWFLSTPFNIVTIFLAPIPISIYALSLVAGVALWRGSQFGRTASLIVQWIQLPKIISPFLIFMFSFGFDFWINLFFAQGHLNFGVQAQFFAFNQFFIKQPDAPFSFGVSVTAALFLAKLRIYRPEQSKEDAILPTPLVTESSDTSPL